VVAEAWVGVSILETPVLWFGVMAELVVAEDFSEFKVYYQLYLALVR
jgi:hypothetical protein